MTSDEIVGILGAGTMGRSIAELCLLRGYSTILFDTNETVLADARERIRTNLEKLVQKGKINGSEASIALNRLQLAAEFNKLSTCSVVIEAIFEDLSIKRTIMANLENVVSRKALLVTNTSSLSVTAIASNCKLKERLLGLHFFNPATIMPLVELVPGIGTTEEVVARARFFAESLGKAVVLAKDTPGFIVNRVARPFYGEALRILDEGIADVASIDRALKEIGGFKMGPFELMDLVGLDVSLKVTEAIYQAFYQEPRFRPSITQRIMVEAGMLGKKTGRGYYDYSKDQLDAGPSISKDLAQQIFMRVLAMLVNEAAHALHYGVASMEDIDLAMTKGLNFPKGLFRWADEIGVSKIYEVLQQMQGLYLEERYRASISLKSIAEQAGSFYR